MVLFITVLHWPEVLKVYLSGMAKVSDSRGGSSYKDLGLSLEGGLAIKKLIRFPKRPETGFIGRGH